MAFAFESSHRYLQNFGECLIVFLGEKKCVWVFIDALSYHRFYD